MEGRSLAVSNSQMIRRTTRTNMRRPTHPTQARPIQKNILHRWWFELRRNTGWFIATAKRHGILTAIRRTLLTWSMFRGWVIICLLGVFGWLIMQKITGLDPSLPTSSAGSHNSSQESQTPRFPTVLPTGKTINQLGGWKRISPADRAPAFAYIDTINDTQLIVTQQPLPDDFTTNPNEKVKQLARTANAKHEIKTGDTTAYLGSNEKGVQQLFLTKNNLLILIKTTERITDSDWIHYLQNLQ